MNQSEWERSRAEAEQLQEKVEKSQGEIYRLKAKLENAQSEKENLQVSVPLFIFSRLGYLFLNGLAFISERVQSKALYCKTRIAYLNSKSRSPPSGRKRASQM